MMRPRIVNIFCGIALLALQSGCAMMDYADAPELKYTPLLNRLHSVVCEDITDMKFSERMRRQNEETSIRAELTHMTMGMNMSVSDRKLFNQRYQKALVCP